MPVCLGRGQQGMYKWDLKEDAKEVVYDFKGFAKDVKVAKINKVVDERANFNQAVHEDDLERLLEVVSEELTNELWERNKNT